MAKERYDHQLIEKVAQAQWRDSELYTTDLADTEKEPYYLLFEFPYPSGDLHIGHWYAYAMPDIYARMLRMQGKNVLFPVGFDSFGLPTENAAIRNGVQPQAWTDQNIARMREQLQSMGGSFDWSKEIVTSSPEYYRWTQWLFAKLFENGLAIRKEAAVKWCPKDQTVLANEQVIDGHCERCGTEIELQVRTQWFLKITQYAERLLADLDALPWREEIKDAQRAWIGESEGAKLRFPVVLGAPDATSDAHVDDVAYIEVFTTRPDTLYGATYVVLAPEHPLVATLLSRVHNAPAVEAYRAATARKSERERSENKEKTGVELEGVSAQNPATGKHIPVYLADYVLASYGTGAVMAVPAHDERDFEFARQHGLPVVAVVASTVTNPNNPPIPGKTDTKRNVIHAILRNRENDTVLVGYLKDASWGAHKPVNFVIGGVEEGEDWQEAAAREIVEETGYTDFVFSQELPIEINAFFFQAQKDVNRDSHVRTFVFDLVSDARSAVEASEEAKHEFRWLPASEVGGALTIPTDQMVWKYLSEGGFAYGGDGRLVNSGTFTGRGSAEARWEIVESVGGERVKLYRMRDWLVSRQRYWGCPIPVVYDPEGTPHAVPPEHLPWLLPTDVDFTGSEAEEKKPSLRNSVEFRERVTRMFGEGWTPEYDTLDVFVDSSWYFLRYLDSRSDHNFTDQGLMKKWTPINRYSGGNEHTTVHLLYSRFFHKALYDLALVPTAEPFLERFNRGIILGPDGQKMSKRWGNVVNPDDMVAQYGSDAVRMYLAFIGPFNEPGHYPWKLTGVESMRRFLDRIYHLEKRVREGSTSPEVAKAFRIAAKKVELDTERFKFNTALSALMVLVRELEQAAEISSEAYQTLLQLLAPYAPHLTEHLWARSGKEGSIHASSWPVFKAGDAETIQTLIVQVGGKKKGELQVPVGSTDVEVLALARLLPAVETALGGREPSRHVYVPGRIINIVLPDVA